MEIGGQWGELQDILSLPYRAALSSACNDNNTMHHVFQGFRGSGVQGFSGSGVGPIRNIKFMLPSWCLGNTSCTISSMFLTANQPTSMAGVKHQTPNPRMQV